MENIDTSKMPARFGLCLAKDTECPLAATCLRSLVLRQQAEAGQDDMFVRVVNSYRDAIHYATEQCTAYATNRKARYACGMTHLFDNVKKSELHTVRSQVMRCFSCESFFYRSQNGTRLIKREEQQKIEQVFKSMNLGKSPLFDSYVEEYVWP